MNADCIQAVMGASGTSKMLTHEGSLVHLKNIFDSTTPIGHKKSGITKYFAKHPEDRWKYVGFYRIPLEVLVKYPGLFTEDELLDDSNIGLIKADDELQIVSELPFIYQDMYVPFFLAHPSASRKQILEIKNSINVDERTVRGE